MTFVSAIHHTAPKMGLVLCNYESYLVVIIYNRGLLITRQL